MALTYRIDTTDGIVVWIDRDGYQILRQPHHPQAYMSAPWDSVEEAENWAITKIAELEAEQQLIQTQQEKLDRILELLEQSAS
jgi:hypothetical protein